MIWPDSCALHQGLVGLPSMKVKPTTLTTMVLVVLLLGKTLRLPVALLIVTGHSMEPTLEPLDLLLAVSPSLKEPEPRDIVVWCTDSLRLHCTVHRLLEINETTIVTKGDNDKTNPAPDPPVPRTMLVYVVAARIPRLAAAAAVVALLALYKTCKTIVRHKRR